MRKWLTLAASAAVLALALPAAAQTWQSINERQAQLEARIDAGVDDGSLTRDEAAQLRTEFRNLQILEGRYRDSGNGLSDSERADLDRRFDTLSGRIVVQRHDEGWVNLNDRQASIDGNIDAGLRDNTLTREEAERFREQFRELERLESQYRASGDGLSADERRDLDDRFDALGVRIYAARTDGQQSGGQNGGPYRAPDYGHALMRDREQYFQQDLAEARNDHGVTYEEIIRLRDDFRVLVQEERRYLDDGRISDSERTALDRHYYDLQWRLEQLRRRH